MTTSDAATTGQVNTAAAEVYEDFFVPALFGQWPERLLDAAGVRDGERVLDVGCGTGVLARTAARRTHARGAVTGLDANEGMLAVAGRAPEAVTWRLGAAEALPFPDRSFDRVMSQFALMFFADPSAALTEMARVVRPGGTVTVATWAHVEESPGYAAMVDLLRRLFGDAEADALLAPFTLGTVDRVRALLGEAFPDVRVTRHEGTARFDSIDAWVHTDVRGWTLADMIDEPQYAELRVAANRDLGAFADRDGRVSFSAPALIAVAAAPPARRRVSDGP